MQLGAMQRPIEVAFPRPGRPVHPELGSVQELQKAAALHVGLMRAKARMRPR